MLSFTWKNGSKTSVTRENIDFDCLIKGVIDITSLFNYRSSNQSINSSYHSARLQHQCQILCHVGINKQHTI